MCGEGRLYGHVNAYRYNNKRSKKTTFPARERRKKKNNRAVDPDKIQIRYKYFAYSNPDTYDMNLKLCWDNYYFLYLSTLMLTYLKDQKTKFSEAT